jgi:hypothetical protein
MISIYDDPSTTMAVTWRFDISVTDGYVEYRKDGDVEYKKVAAETGEFKSDIDHSRMFWVHLVDLLPDTKYYYTCGDEQNRSEEYFFTTAPENLEKFKFICVADQQKGEPHECPDYSYFNNLLKETLKKHPDARFILTGGDNTDCGQHEVQWNGALLGFKDITEYIPLQMAVGNHDNRGFADYKNGIGRYYAEPAEFFNKQFKGSYKYDGPGIWKTECYTFDYGNVHFSVIGINGPEEVNDWLISDLDKNNSTWKIGVYHFPICYSGVDCQNYDAYPVMREGMEKLDILFSGHEHNFSRSFPLRNEELFEKPSCGTVHYMLGNSNQNPPGSKTMSKIWHAAYYAQEERNACVTVVEVDGDKITITAELDDGRIADKCVIDKGKDEILPHAVAPFFGPNRTKMFFKGMDLGLMQADLCCRNIDGIWYGALGLLAPFVGGDVRKTEGKIRLDMYAHWAEFTENSDIAETDRGQVKLPATVKRLNRDQLYIPFDAVHIFEMRWAYAKRNNFISVEHESEAKHVTAQP